MQISVDSLALQRLASTLRLCQLVSPTLPLGAYSHSRGLEYAVAVGWVKDERTATDWIVGQLDNTLANLDIPVLARLSTAWRTQDSASLTRWNRLLRASRESSELIAEDRCLGAALARVLVALGIAEALKHAETEEVSFASVFSLACVHWHIPLEEAACGYLWTWAENQTTAAVKLVPLGQTVGQRILSQAVERIPSAACRGLRITDEDIGSTAPGLGIASALHETQYTRLFRS